MRFTISPFLFSNVSLEQITAELDTMDHSDPKELANNLSDDDFYHTFVKPAIASKPLPQPTDSAIEYYSWITLPEATLQHCFKVTEETSADMARATSIGWDSDRKLAEMREEHMRHLVIQSATGSPVAFSSFMVSEEDGIDVIFVYDIHVVAESRRKGYAATLMQVMEEVGCLTKMKEVMLSVFVANPGAIEFYSKQGYTKYKDEKHPKERKRLRPGYVIPEDWTPGVFMMRKVLQ